MQYKHQQLLKTSTRFHGPVVSSRILICIIQCKQTETALQKSEMPSQQFLIHLLGPKAGSEICTPCSHHRLGTPVMETPLRQNQVFLYLI